MADSDVAYLQLASENFGAALNVAASAAETKKARNWQEQMYARQRADALADYEMKLGDIREMQAEQRKYDSYESKVERLKDAGLNPSLAYGGENSGVQISSQNDVRPSSVPSPATPSPVGAALGGFTQAGFRAAQIALQNKQVSLERQRVDFQRELSSAQALKALAERHLIDNETYNKGLENIWAESTLGKRIEQVNLSVEEANARISEIRQSVVESLSRIRLNDATISKIDKDISLIEQNIKNLGLYAQQIEAETIRTVREADNLIFERDKIVSDALLADARTSLTEVERQCKEIEKTLLSVGVRKAEVDAILAPLEGVTRSVGNVFSFGVHIGKNKTSSKHLYNYE